VPNDEQLREMIIAQAHDSNIAAHPGIRRTQLSISQWYYWKSLEEDVKLYVSTCETCNRYKTSSLKANGKMIPIEAPNECWHTISADWITGLPVSKGYDAIMTVVDKLSKRAKYLPTQSTADAPQTAKLFFNHVVRHHGVPSVIISDRDPKFTGNFWKALMELMGIKQPMTTAGRAQADGATERQNRTLEDSLRCQVSYLGEDWADHLPTIEYAHPGLVQASTGLTPFEIDTGRKLRNPVVDSLLSNNEYAKNFAEHRQEVLKLAQENLKKAQARQKAYYDRKRSKVEFRLGDFVMLATRTLPLKHAQQKDKSERPKLVPRFIGPFEIIKVVNSNAMKLNLPKSMDRIHNVFNVDRLKHYKANPEKIASRPIPKATPVIEVETGEKTYIIEALLKKRQVRRRTEYLVKWHGYDESESTWEPEDSIKHVFHFQRLLQELDVRMKNR
jgi:transposase-like protein